MLKIRPLQSWKIRKAMVKAARDRQFESKLARTLEQTVLNTWPTRPLGPAMPLSTTTSTSNTNTNEKTSCHKHFSTLGLQLTHHVHNPIARVQMVCALCIILFWGCCGKWSFGPFKFIGFLLSQVKYKTPPKHNYNKSYGNGQTLK